MVIMKSPDNIFQSRDDIYAAPLAEIADFQFDKNVAEVFPDMIRRSVPGYQDIVDMTGLLCGHFARPEANYYDLGSSLGAATLAMRRHINLPDCRIIAVDNSPAMVARCREFLTADNSASPVLLVCGDVRDVPIENAAMVVLNFTLQFLPPEDRPGLLRTINQGLLPGGILVLSEKIALEDERFQELFTTIHHAFKKTRGYSELEISQKRSALEKVLIPETLETHLRRLREAGFERSEVWYQCFNFASLVSIKAG